MPWLTIAYSMTAAACVTLALVHLFIWFKQPAGRAHLLFSMTAISVAAITPFELLMARAQTVEEFGLAVRWAHVPVALVVVSVVWFLWFYLGTGRLWLAYAAGGLRVLSLMVNFSLTPNLNYREITGLRQVALPWGETASTAIGVTSPWTLMGQLSLLLLLVYIVDASVTLWRRGDLESRRRAVIVGGGMVVFILGSAGHFALVLLGLIASPVILSFFFLAIVVAMGYELSLDVVSAAQLSLEVRANEQRLALAQEAGDIGTFDWDIRTGEVRWTDQLESIYGLPPGSFGGTFESWRARVHPEDLPRCEAEINETVKQKLPGWQTKFRMFRADNGEMRWIDAKGRLFFDAQAHPVRMLGVNTDISERLCAEESVRESEQRFRNMADTAPVLIWISGPDKLRTYFNQGWLEFTGRTLEQELANGWFEGVYSKDSARCLENYNSAFERHEPLKMEYRLRRADGVFRWILDIGTPRFSSDGEFLGFIGSCIDITDRKEAEEALRDLGGRLINAQEEERSRIARELHDDLSQRIAVLSIGLEQIGQQIPEGPDNLHARVRSLRMETQEVSTELHRLSYQLHPSKLDHLGLVAAVRSFCEELATQYGISIKFRHQGFPAALPKDITLCLFRVTQESLHNVVRHSGAREAQVMLEKTDQAVQLFISDKGCGFDTESSKMTSGLGFISMRERLRLVGGHLSIRSHQFQGTKLQVTVPLMKHAEPAPVRQAAKVQTSGVTGGVIDESSKVQ